MIAKAASKVAAELPNAAQTKPNLLPILLIICAAKKVKIAVPTTDNATGNVDKDCMEVSCEPIIAPKKTVIAAFVNPNTWLKTNSDKFLFI